MSRLTPPANRWPLRNIDEERPLLDAGNGTIPTTSNPPPLAVISKKTRRNSFPVDHGWLPWIQVIAGWILFANSWGLPSAYGTFQTYYTQSSLSEYSAASVAWIGSVQLFLCTLGCLPAGILLDQGYLRTLIAAGSILQFVGLTATSFSTEFWQILVAQGIFVGFGCGLLALLPVAVISMYFEEKRMLAAGIAATGASIAGIIQPILLKRLFEIIGFSWTVRLLAVAILFSNAFPLCVMRLQSKGAEDRSRFTLTHFKDLTYSAFVLTFTLIQAAAMVPIFFIPDYALRLGIDETVSSHLLAVINLASLFGRFVPNFLADRYGGINTLIPLVFTAALLLATLPLFKTLTSLTVFCVLYGFASGGTLVLPAAIVTKLCPNAADIGVRMGLAYLFAAFGGLVGNPIAGMAKKEGNHSAVKEFRGVWWVASGVISMALIALLATRRLKVGTIFGRSFV